MKDRSKHYLLGISLLSVLFLGILFSKFNEAELKDELEVVISMSSIVVTPDIKVYSESAAAIIMGKVETVEERVTESGSAYIRPVLDAQVKINEVLKGDSDMTSVSIMMFGNSENVWTEDGVTLQPGENVLLFLCKNSAGDYVVCAESAGKCLIDENDNVIGAEAFSMPLEELKLKIQAALIQ